MTGDRDDDEHSGRQADDSTPWHHSTGKVLGASIAGLAAIGLIVTGVMYASRSGESPQAPTNFVDPTFSSMTSRSTDERPTSVTTTRISPPLTTDLDLPPELAPPPPAPPSESETSPTRGRSTTQEEESEESEESEEESSPRTTTRNRPRLNETRTLYPRP